MRRGSVAEPRRWAAQVAVEYVPKKPGGTRKRIREEKEAKQRKQHMPQAPQGQFGSGGAQGQGTGGTLLTQHLLGQKGMLRPRSKELDPRELILRHADAAAKDPQFVENAYLETQARRWGIVVILLLSVVAPPLSALCCLFERLPSR